MLLTAGKVFLNKKYLIKFQWLKIRHTTLNTNELKNYLCGKLPI